MSVPTDRQYTAEHEWVIIADGVATVGVTEFAANALGDVVFVELPTAGEVITTGESCGEIESTKSVSDLYAPVSGEVEAINDDVVESPELVNEDPYGRGWLYTVRVEGEGDLLDPEAYSQLTKD